MTTLDIHVDGSPRTKGSWRPIQRNGGGVFLKPQTDERPWRDSVAWVARHARPVMIAKPASCRVVLSFGIKQPKKSKNTFPAGDVDKLARSVMDALTGIAYEDDVQVTKLEIEKCWSSMVGVRIQVITC